MKKTLMATAALVLWTGAAHALEKPQPAVPLDKGGDPHVQVVHYDPTQQVLVYGAVNRPMTIQFSANESVVDVPLEAASGNEQAPWQGTQAAGDSHAKGPVIGNVLPLWVTRPGRSTAQVVTRLNDGSGTMRVYQFLLIGLPAQPNDCPDVDCDDPRLTTGLTFIYLPARKSAKPDPKVLEARALAQTKAAEARLRTNPFYGVRNWKYDAKGDPAAVKDLAPDQVSDNSQVTAFLYRGNRQVPAFYIVEAGGTERQITPQPDKDMLVIYETARHWRLRKGREVIDLQNVGYDSIGVNPQTGTTSPEVVRVIRTASEGR